MKLLSTSLLPRWYLNTVIDIASVTFFPSFAEYAFAMYKFWGHEVLFVIILSAMMIPTKMLIIPWHVVIAKLKLIDTYLASSCLAS